MVTTPAQVLASYFVIGAALAGSDAAVLGAFAFASALLAFSWFCVIIFNRSALVGSDAFLPQALRESALTQAMTQKRVLAVADGRALGKLFFMAILEKVVKIS
jgi:hypothetical protein